MNELTIVNQNGQQVIDSREVAEMIGKPHNDLMKSIRTYCEYLGQGKISQSEFFIESTYQNSQNKTQPCYLLTKKGCDMVANKMTGEKGVLFTAAYVTAFERMREALQPKLPSYAEALRQLADKIEENDKLLAENTEMRPKAEYFDDLVDRNLLTNFRETAKELGVKEKAFIQWLISSKYLYRDQAGKLLPYANAKNEGLFKVKECVSKRNSWSGTQTLVTPKGRETFRLLYHEN